MKPALGYRFDFHDRSIASSGDTTPLVKMLVLSHLTPEHGIPDATWHREAAKAFRGRIVVAQDLMVI